MVSSVINRIVGQKSSSAERAAVAQQPRVVELVGPAGVGKTTLLRALCQREVGIRAGLEPGKAVMSKCLIHNLATLYPVFVRRYRHTRWFTWNEMRAMLYLQSWHYILRQRTNTEVGITLFDHGPIFRLVMLRECGPEITKAEEFQRWWDRMREEWASTLDLIVWLDAPNSVLLPRLRLRGHPTCDDMTDKQAYEFLQMYRRAFEDVIGRFETDARVQVLRFNTHHLSTESIADRVLLAATAGIHIAN